MVKRSLGTLLNDGLVALLGSIGTYKIGEFGYNLGQMINKTYSADLQKMGGKTLPMIAEYGPMAILGGIALYGTYLALNGADKLSLEKQIVKYNKDLQKMQRNAQDAQEDITANQEYILQVQKDGEKKQKNIRELEDTLGIRSASEAE